jgi:hypothetical protein
MTKFKETFNKCFLGNDGISYVYKEHQVNKFHGRQESKISINDMHHLSNITVPEFDQSEDMSVNQQEESDIEAFKSLWKVICF